MIIAAYALYTLNLEFFWGAVLWILEPLKGLLIAFRIVKGPYWGIFSRAGAYTIAGEAAQADSAAAAYSDECEHSFRFNVNTDSGRM